MHKNIKIRILPFTLLYLILVFSSCIDGEKRKVKMIEGDWEITSIYREYYDNNVIDSTFLQNDCGTIKFWKVKEFGDFIIYFSTVPAWQDPPLFSTPGIDRILSDPFLDSRIIFSVQSILHSIAYSTLELSNTKIRMFIYQYHFDGTIDFKETIELNAYN